MPTLIMFLLWLSSVVHVSLFDARNFLAAQTAQLHVAHGWLFQADLSRHVSSVKAYTTDTIAQVPGWTSRVLEAVHPVAQTIAVFLEQLHYRSTLQQAFQAAVSFAAAGFDSLDAWRRNSGYIVAAQQQLLFLLPQQAVSPNTAWGVAANLSLIYLLARFLLIPVATHTFVLLLHRFSPHNTKKDLHATTSHPSASPLYSLLNILALPFYLVHQLGVNNLPPLKAGESLIFRRLSITALVPLWCYALTAAMVLFTFGSVTDFLSRTVMGIFRRQAKPAEWHSLDVERGQQQWQPHSAASSEDMTKMPGAWGSTRVWEDLRRDQGALQQERVSLDAEKAAFQAEAQRALEEKRAFDLEKQRLREERAAFQQQQQKFQRELLASAQARKEIEGIIKMFIEKSKRSGEIIGNLRTRVDGLPVINGNMLGNPTPPASPKMEKGYRSEKVEFAKGYAQSQRKARIQAAATAIAV